MYILNQLILLMTAEKKNFHVQIHKIEVVILHMIVKELIIKDPGAEREDTMSFTNFMKSLNKDGQEFLFQLFHPKRLLVIKIQSLLMKDVFT